MDSKVIRKSQLRQKRALRVRSHLHGSQTKPRLCVVKSNAHIQAQLIDDDAGKTLGSISTCGKEFRGTEFAKKNKASARQLGLRIAQIAKQNSVKQVVFDRGPFKYHGVIAELANAAREAGLQF
jgi:large subunit ribosomal protein L18